MKTRPPLDLGNGHCFEFTTLPGTDEATGGIHYHPSPTGEECVGTIYFPGYGPPAWDVVQEDPLTVSPSLRCSCGSHGFIREGKWVEA